MKYILNQDVDKKIWVKNKFLTFFNEFYKIANLLQREEASVEPNIQLRQLRSLCTPNKYERSQKWSQTNPGKTNKQQRCK